MRNFVIISFLLTSIIGLSACNKPEDKPVEVQPAFDLVPQREQLQKAKDLEKKMQQDAEDQRKVIELQTK
jgi:hypothetical protein